MQFLTDTVTDIYIEHYSFIMCKCVKPAVVHLSHSLLDLPVDRVHIYLEVYDHHLPNPCTLTWSEP